MDEKNLPAAGSPSPSASSGPIQSVQPPASQALTTTTPTASAAPLSPADPQALAMRERSLIDGILTNESLTSDLDDDAAKEMIDWSISMAREAVQQTAGLEEHQAEKAVSERMYNHHKLMRAVKRLVLEKNSLDDQGRRDLVELIRSQRRAFYGDAVRSDVDPNELLRIAQEPADRPGRAVSRLRGALDPHLNRSDNRPDQRNARGE